MALGIEDKVFVLEVGPLATLLVAFLFVIAQFELIFKTHSSRIVSIITRHLQDISVLKFAYNDHYLITASNDSTIIVWDFNE